MLCSYMANTNIPKQFNTVSEKPSLMNVIIQDPNLMKQRNLEESKTALYPSNHGNTFENIYSD